MAAKSKVTEEQKFTIWIQVEQYEVIDGEPQNHRRLNTEFKSLACGPLSNKAQAEKVQHRLYEAGQQIISKLTCETLIKEIEGDPSHLCSLILDEFNVHCCLLGKERDNLKYYFLYKNQLLFIGDNFKTPPVAGLGSLSSVLELISNFLLCTAKGEDNRSVIKCRAEAMVCIHRLQRIGCFGS